MLARDDGLTLQDLLVTEAVKDLEAHTPLRDDAALAEAVAGGDDRAVRVLVRARRRAADTGIDLDVARLRDRLISLGLLLAALGVVLATMVALTLLGDGHRINAVAAIVMLIAPNVLGIVVWAAFVLLGPRGSGAGAFGRAVSAVARHRRAPEHVRRVWPAAARVLDAQGLTAWALGGLNHLLWAMVYAAAALILAAAFALSQYRLGWETTILAPQTLHDIARAIARWPGQIGLPADVPAQLDDPDASRLLGRWLIAGTLAYGTMPRVLLALLCGAVLLRRRRGLALDLDEPYHRRVIARLEALAPTRVIDAEHAPPVAPRALAGGAAEAGKLVLIGFELPTELPLPPALLQRAAWNERLDGGLEERQAVLRRLADHPPARLLLACHAPSTPDRGTLRFLEAARAGAVTLLLGDGTHAARWRDWLDAAGRNDIAVLTDAEAALAHG
ncbi:DUF2868 domain-containing protein [Piscinibacter aquaticus]|uniref:DUF2868 domain-containing protein n=1 Tax=Piscinibacter aquaticus TaxID=392597 RepID=A0A5C6TXD3_9BURK|nr:DUF2868 domain-containing protein [Piscinibacter aquaticus]